MARKAAQAPRTRGIASKKFPYAQMVQELDNKDSRTQRVAYYLDWAATHLPYQYQPYNVIVQAINDRKRLVRMDSDEVQGVRNTLYNVRKTLQKVYGRDMDVAAAGVRATVNDEDAAAVVLPKRAKRIRSARNAFMASHAIIDPSRIQDPKVRAYMDKSVKDLVKMIGSDSFEKKLLPPGSSDD